MILDFFKNFILFIMQKMPIKKHSFDLHEASFDLSWKKSYFKTGKLAVQTDSSIEFKYWENVLLFSTCMEKNPNPDKDFMPLMIDFRESYSAAGRIAGAIYRRREWRPPESAILYARLTDRALRPMFPKGMINDTVISITPLALDHTMELDVMTIIGSSVSIMSAGIPFDGPVWAAQIWYKDGEFIINPTIEQLETSLLNLLVAGKRWSINMIECGANEVPTDILKEAFKVWQAEIDKSCDIQLEFLKKLTIQELEVQYNKPSTQTMEFIQNIITDEKLELMTWNGKEDFNKLFSEYEKECLAQAEEKIENSEEWFDVSKIKMWVFNHIKHFIRSRSLDTWKRIDDRSEKEIRPLYCEVDLLPRVHGAWLFRRWETQVLNTTTLGWPMDYLVYDDMEHDNVKQRYFHHYNFPPFSVWEAKGTRWQNRREIWHGKLAEKALMPMIPSVDDFPYSIRTVSECLGSGGSTSMWSVCSSTLSLMDAWVPLKKPVAWIAMWLITDHEEDWTINKYMILNDLKWTEDFTWDMDFKVAGTKDWVTAIQLDTKLKWITMDIVLETIDRSFEWYNEIMDFMLLTIPEPNKQVKEHAPKIKIIRIKPDKIREVIWKWWEVIDKIIEQCDNIKIDFEDDGRCFLTHKNQDIITKAEDLIMEIASDLEVWQKYEWKISRIEEYGLFIDLPKWKKWLCHISNLWQKYEWPLSKYFKLWDTMNIVITNIDQQGKIQIKRAL